MFNMKNDDWGEFVERREGPTLHGGAYLISIFADNWHNPCRKEDATQIEAIEFDKDDREIMTTWLYKEGKYRDERPNISITQ